jgi:hypothetical protein
MSRALNQRLIGAAMLLLAMGAGGLVSKASSPCHPCAATVAPTRPDSTPARASTGQAASGDSAAGVIGVDCDARRLQYIGTLC